MPQILHDLKDKFGSKSDQTFKSQSDAKGGGQIIRLRSDDDILEGGGLWEQAWKHVSKEVDWKLPPNLQHVEGLSTRTEVENIKTEALARRDAQESNQKMIWGTKYTFREVCDKVSSCAQKFEFVGDMVTQAEPVYSALPWTAIRFIIGCAVGESETYHNILDGVELVAGLILQYPSIEQVYSKLASDTSNELRKSLLHLYKLILRFQLHAIKYFDPDHKVARTFTGLNPVKADGIKTQLAAIEKAKQKTDADIALVDAEVTKIGIDNIETGQASQSERLIEIKAALKALSGEMKGVAEEQRAWMSDAEKRQDARNQVFVDLWREPLDELKEELENERKERERENLHNVRRWLSRTEPESDYAEARGKRLMNLGEWLIQHRKFKQWQDSKSPSLLWLHGFAGTGKTGLTCRVVAEMRKKIQNASVTEEAGRLAIFFCSSDKPSTDRGEVSRADPREVLRSIISQLATSQHGRYVASMVQEKYEANGPDSDDRRPLNETECIDILSAITRYVPITIILDAFDELDQQRSSQLIQNLKAVMRQCPQGVKIFVSTRPFPAVEDDLANEQSIEVTAENNGEDVKTFIHRTLEARIDDGSLLNGKVSDELQHDIRDILTKRAQNMFLYASLLLTQLCDKNRTDDEQSIRRKLEGLPKDITEAYNQIMTEVHDDRNNSERSCRIAQDTFKLLLYSQEPLEHKVLREAVSPPERKVDNDELLHVCRTLVTRGKSTYEFAHYSVREHIGRMEEYRASRCHIVAVKSCLRVLIKMFGTEVPQEELSESQKGLGQYALLYWPLHYESIDRADLSEHRSTVNAMLRTFLVQGRSKENRYQNWFTQASKRIKPMEDKKSLAAKFEAIKGSPLTPLFAASVFGMEDLISKFGRELHELNRSNEHGQTALCLAIEHNKIGVVKALLASRFPADINLLNVRAVQQFVDWDNNHPPAIILFASALQCAAATGRYEIAEYLIAQGAHVDLVAGYYGSPLQAAALRGHAAIVELLLKHNAEPNSQGGFFAASAAGQVDIINILLEHKPPAMISTPGGHYGSALMAAVSSGNSDTVFALLEEKADPTLRSKGHGKPLEKAAQMGYSGKQIVKDLLEFKADADLSHKGEEVHLLHKAAMFDIPELARYCLKEKCKIDMITTKGPWYERRFGDWSHEMTPLAYACAEGHVGMVKLLLGEGASLERDKDSSAVLWLAAYQGRADVVDMLITTFKITHDQAAINKFYDQRPGTRSGHPLLWAACTSTSPETVRVLLDHGVPYQSNWYKATPLLATATYGRPNIARCLLEYHEKKKIDACIDQRAKNDRTALYEACDNHRGSIVAQLLEAGADYNILDGKGQSLLHAATHHDNFGIMHGLLERISEDMAKTFPSDKVDAAVRQYIDIQSHWSGQTALIHATERNKMFYVALLLDKGADYTLSGHAGNNPLHFASRAGNDEIVTLLLETARPFKESPRDLRHLLDARNGEGATAMYQAAWEGRAATVQLLLMYGADYNIQKEAGTSTLHAAVWNEHKEIVIALLEKSSKDPNPSRSAAFLNSRNSRGLTPLMDAVGAKGGKPNQEIIELLLGRGVDVSIPKSNDVNVLHAACFGNWYEISKLLIEYAEKTLSPARLKAFLNYQNFDGRTPLMDAVAPQGGKPCMEIIKLLLAHGIDYTIPKNNGVTVLHHTAFHAHRDTLKLLLDHASTSLDPPAFQEFINHRNFDRKTALVDAAQRDRPLIATWLLDYGIDYTIRDKEGFTALHYCVARNGVATVRVLLEKISTLAGGRDSAKFQSFINAQSDSNGKSALHDAMDRCHPEVPGLLFEYGVEFETYDKKKRTPLHAVIDKKNGDVALRLLEYASKDQDKEKFKRFLQAREDGNMENAWEGAKRRGMGRVVQEIEKLEREGK
ncbi:MAG: hypothetical protein Q9220_002644 [cf. Caloplaca sp. 1 TL-2023]